MEKMDISIVIPTYNRSEQLSKVIDFILQSEIDDASEVEIIVVDDGSPQSVQPVIDSKNPSAPFSIKLIRQENAGPAKARNTGFFAARNRIVLFIDDDILVTPTLIKEHLNAHRKLDRSVVFGKCPFEIPSEKTPAYRFLTSLESVEETEEFTKIDVVASGNISVEKEMFGGQGVYKDNLKTPAAEEFELEHRLVSSDIPIYIVNNAIGWHLQPATIQDKAKQEYKYGIGVAEVWLKISDVIKNEHIVQFIKVNGFINENDGAAQIAKKSFKRLISYKLFRTFFLKTTNLLEVILPFDALLFPLYRFLCGIYLFAGVRDGIKKFS